MKVTISTADYMRGARPPRGYRRAGPLNDRLGRFWEFYPAPVAWAILTWDWLFSHTIQVVMVWLYDLAAIDCPENVDARWGDLIRSFTLSGPEIYRRQRARARPGDAHKWGYERGFEAGRESVLGELKREVEAATRHPNG